MVSASLALGALVYRGSVASLGGCRILSRTLIIFIFTPILFEIQTVVTSTSVVIKRQVLYLNTNSTTGVKFI